MSKDIRDILRAGDGGGEVWDQLEARLDRTPVPAPITLLLERLGLTGTVIEAVLRHPGPAPMLAALSVASLLLGILLQGQTGMGTLWCFMLAPLLGGLCGALGFRQDFDVLADLTRSATSARVLLFARLSLVFLVFGVLVLPLLVWFPSGGWLLWLCPTLLVNAVSLTVGLRFGGSAGMGAGVALWLWLLADRMPTEPGGWSVPAFPTETVQLVLALVQNGCVSGTCWLPPGPFTP